VKTLPGIREAIEQRNWTEAQEQTAIVTRTLQGFVAHVQEATRLLQP